MKTGNTQEVNVSSLILDKIEARGVGFSELQSYWSLPFHDFAVVGDVAIFPDKHNRQSGLRVQNLPMAVQDSIDL